MMQVNMLQLRPLPPGLMSLYLRRSTADTIGEICRLYDKSDINVIAYQFVGNWVRQGWACFAAVNKLQRSTRTT